MKSAPSSGTILHTEASRGFGGQELRIITESQWLLEHGWRVVIAAQPGSRLLREAESAALPTAAVAMRGALDPRAFMALRRLVRARGVALVHTHSSIDSWLAGLAARSLGVPVVRSRHVTIPIPPRRALVYRLADRIIASGEAVADVVARAGVPRAKIVCVPAGIDTRRFHPDVSGAAVRAEFQLPVGGAVGLVANIRGSKGHDVFLDAARIVRDALPATRFLIVGDGVGFDEIRRRVTALQLDSTVIMTGFRRDVPEVMAALDVLVLPSTRSEATSQVIPQALAIGVPIVATAVGGIPEIIRDGETGYLVPPADAKALAEAIVCALRDPASARAMARRGRERVSETFTLESMMRATTGVYAECLRRRA